MPGVCSDNLSHPSKAKFGSVDANLLGSSFASSAAFASSCFTLNLGVTSSLFNYLIVSQFKSFLLLFIVKTVFYLDYVLYFK
jgi:hypothetical protein